MPFQPFEFDDSIAQTEPGRPHVPPGWYLLTKINMEPTPEDYARTTGVFTTFRFKEGPSHAPDAGKGREIRDYSTLGAGVKNGRGSQFGLGMQLGAMGFSGVAKKLPGVKVTTYAEFKALIDQINQGTGSPDVCALIADQDSTTGNGRTFSGIEEYLPASEWPNVKNSLGNPNLGPRVQSNGTTAAPPPPAPPQDLDALKARATALFSEQPSVA